MSTHSQSGEQARGYHHGDLRRRLVEVGEALLEERGIEGFTLRECARRAGVSPSSPSHHFGNVTGLLSAIAVVGFDGLTEAQEASLVGLGDDPEGRLRAIGGAYIRYAVAHPARFRVAFGNLPLDHSDVRLIEAGGRAMGVLKREILAARSGDDGPGFDVDVAYAWAAVHGFASLQIDRHLCFIVPTYAPDAYLDELADHFLKLVSGTFNRSGSPSTVPGRADPSGG